MVPLWIILNLPLVVKKYKQWLNPSQYLKLNLHTLLQGTCPVKVYAD